MKHSMLEKCRMLHVQEIQAHAEQKLLEDPLKRMLSERAKWDIDDLTDDMMGMIITLLRAMIWDRPYLAVCKALCDAYEKEQEINRQRYEATMGVEQ